MSAGDLIGKLTGTGPTYIELSDGTVVQAVVQIGLAGSDASTTTAPVAIADGANLDAFSRLRVGLPKLRLSALFDTDLRPLLWDTSLTATGTVTKNANHIGADLAAPASGDVAILQTKEYFVYRAGQSQAAFVTLNFQGEGTNVTKEAGYFDDSNGMFFRLTSAGASVVIRSDATGSVVDSDVAQANWNVDPFDGTGPSGITVDWSKTQILVLDFQALFVGRVRFWLDIGGALLPAHDQNHANVETIPYISTAKLPIRYRIEATGAPTDATMLAVCSTVVREGGDDEPSIQHEARSNASINVGTAWETVLGLRLKSTHIRATLRMQSAALFNEDTDFVEYACVLNPAYTGTPTWVDIDADNSGEIARFNAAITVNGAGDPTIGHVYPLGGFVPSGSNKVEAAPATSRLGDTVPVVADIAGTPDEVWLVARASTGTSDVRGMLAWVEER